MNDKVLHTRCIASHACRGWEAADEFPGPVPPPTLSGLSLLMTAKKKPRDPSVYQGSRGFDGGGDGGI